MKRLSIFCFVTVFSILLISCQLGMLKKANSSLRNHDFANAILLYKQHLSNNPNSTVTKIKLGYALLKNGQYKESISQLVPIIESDSYRSFAVLYLGLAHLHLNEVSKTISTWERYSSPNYPLIEKQVVIQTENLKTNELELSTKMVLNIDSAIMSAIQAEKLKSSYNLSRLGECG